MRGESREFEAAAEAAGSAECRKLGTLIQCCLYMYARMCTSSAFDTCYCNFTLCAVISYSSAVLEKLLTQVAHVSPHGQGSHLVSSA